MTKRKLVSRYKNAGASGAYRRKRRKKNLGAMEKTAGSRLGQREERKKTPLPRRGPGKKNESSKPPNFKKREEPPIIGALEKEKEGAP